MSSIENTKFNETDIKVISKGLWVDEKEPEQFILEIEVSNHSPFDIKNLQLLITSVPQGVIILSEKKYHFPELKSKSTRSAKFKINGAKIKQVGFLESAVTFYDHSETMHSIGLISIKIE